MFVGEYSNNNDNNDNDNNDSSNAIHNDVSNNSNNSSSNIILNDNIMNDKGWGLPRLSSREMSGGGPQKFKVVLLGDEA